MTFRVHNLFLNLMKKYISIIVLSFIAYYGISQQTPSEIAEHLRKYERQLRSCDAGADSVYHAINQQLEQQNNHLVNAAIWHSCMAEFLEEYYRINRYNISSRTHLEDAVPQDINVWDGRTLKEQIVYHFRQSVTSSEELFQQPIELYRPLLDTLIETQRRPTLYDFLAFRYLDYLIYDAGESNYNVNDDALWASNEVFTNLQLPISDEEDRLYLSFSILQRLTRLHLNDTNNYALLDITMRRLSLLTQYSKANEKEVRSREFLLLLAEQYKNQPGYEMVTYALGQHYEKYASAYNLELNPEYVDYYAQAVTWYERTMSQAHRSIEGRNAQANLSEILKKELALRITKFHPANQDVLVTFQYKNCEAIHLRVLSMTTEEYEKLLELNRAYRKEDLTLIYNRLLKEKAVYETSISLPIDTEHRMKSGQFRLPALNSGFYVCLASYEPFDVAQSEGFLSTGFEVTDLFGIYRKNGDTYEVIVCDRTSGKPLKNVKVVFTTYTWDHRKGEFVLRSIHKFKTDKEGKCACTVTVEKNEKARVSIELQRGEERYEVLKAGGYASTTQNLQFPVKIEAVSYLFTDRNLYRPGQTVYFKGIIVERSIQAGEDRKKQLLAGVWSEVELLDANGQRIEVLTLQSNEYGAYSGSFLLPDGGVTGQYSIRSHLIDSLNQPHAGAKFHSCRFAVEEYKRPTFEVTLAPPKEEFQLGQQVQLSGKVQAYAGYGIDGATVSYRVQRTSSFPWWRWRWQQMPQVNSREVAFDTVHTDENGAFTLSFLAQPGQDLRHNPLYNFVVTVEVTDITGETHSTSTSVFISQTGLILQTDIPEQIALETKSRYTVQITNLAGKIQSGTIHYTLSELRMPSSYRYDSGKRDHLLSDSADIAKAFPYLNFGSYSTPDSWEVLALVHEGEIESGVELNFSIPHLENLKEGYYKAVFTTYDRNQHEIIKEHIFVLYREQPKRRCLLYEPVSLLERSDSKHYVGDTVKVLVGTYLKEAHLLCEVISNNRLVESHWITLNQSMHEMIYPLKEEDRGSLIFHVYGIQNNRPYEATLSFEIVSKEQTIDIELLTFRDKTLPGSNEQYRLRLRNGLGEKIAAEMLCSMYDASLDALTHPHTIYRTINHWNRKTYNYRYRANIVTVREHFRPFMSEHYQWDEVKYPMLKFDVFSIFSRHVRHTVSGSVFERDETSNRYLAENASLAEVKLKEEAFMDDGKGLDEEIPSAQEEAVDIRRNFKETAFFLPHLQTDEQGDIYVDFTMPESLTRWKLQGFAHSHNLAVGYFERYVQTSKKLMVVPNAPRFFRENDTLVFSAKVVNMDTVTQSGFVTLNFRNALNGETLPLTLSDATVPFDVAPGESREVHFPLYIPSNLSAITYQILAANTESPIFSDGEEATLPVLTNRISVTESQPLHISGKGSKTFTLDKLKKSFSIDHPTLSTQSLTLEFTPNPIWYAIQALPYLMEYPYACNEQIFSRYYANVLATDLLSKHPKVAQVFARWQNSSAEAFCSQLEKNQELKTIILEETPWVIEAQSESARKQNMAFLFDLTKMAGERKTSCEKLENCQNSDGGWAWFSGGESSLFITQHILAGIGHLNSLNISTDFREHTLKMAIQYIDREVSARYQERKARDLSAWGSLNIHYLYARSFFLDQEIPDAYREAYDFYYNNLKKDWGKQSYYMQGMAALICYRNGDQELAVEIIKHLKSMAQDSDEMGMYWKREGDGLFWYEAPIERQALLIEAFHTITHDEESVEKMQLWLLKQKQMQSWSTTKSTTEAIYALLLNNNQLEQTGGVSVRLGDWNYTECDTIEQAESGSGYIKKCWPGNEVTEAMATVEIEKQTAGPAWGGLYWQYLEDLNRVEQSQDRNFSVQKQLYRVVIGKQGEELSPITEETPIRVGDKVRVRVEIRTDRQMEYVHLKDMRACCFEPVNVLSGYKRQGTLRYYESTRDAATNFFIDYLPKGTHVFEYTLTAVMSGTFSNGITTIQCMYAPEFTSHSEGTKVKVQAQY